MADIEIKAGLIEEYAKLQRIKAAPDRDAEIDYQIKTVKAKLESIGINIKNLDK